MNDINKIKSFTDIEFRIIKAFQDSIQQEAHILSQYPDLLWQQLFNRLQWDLEEKTLSESLKNHSCKQFHPWLQQITPTHKPHSLIRTIIGHSRPINCAELTRDSKILVTGGQDNLVNVWDIETGRLIHTLSGHKDSITSCSISTNQWLLTGARDNLIKVWNLSDGNEKYSLKGHNSFISQVKINQDGSWGVTTSVDNSLLVWDFLTGKQISQQIIAKASPVCIIPSAHIKKFIFISKNNEICLWENGQIKIIGSHADQVISLDLFPSNKQILTTSKDKLVKIWSFHTNSEVSIVGHDSQVCAGCISPDENWIATGDIKGNIIIWDNKGSPRAKFKAHSNEVSHLRFSPDGNYILTSSGTSIYSGGSDFNLKLWSVPSGEFYSELNGHAEAISFSDFTNEGSLIVSCSLDNTIKIWQVPQQKIVEVRDSHQGAISSCRFINDSNKVISCGLDKTIRIWDIPTLKLISKIENLQKPAFACTVLKDNKQEKILYATVSGLIHYDPKSGRSFEFSTQKQIGSNINFAAFSQNSKNYIIAEFATSSKLEHYSVIRILNTENGKEIAFFKGHSGNVYSCALSSDQKILASGGLDKSIILWKVNKGIFDRSGEIATLTCHIDAVSACTFSPDGRFLISGDVLGELIIWDVSSTKIIQRLKAHSDRVTTIQFSPDGQYFITGGFDKFVKVWEFQQKKELTKLPVEGRIYCGSMALDQFLIVIGDEGGNLRVIKPICL